MENLINEPEIYAPQSFLCVIEFNADSFAVQTYSVALSWEHE